MGDIETLRKELSDAYPREAIDLFAVRRVLAELEELRAAAKAVRESIAVEWDGCVHEGGGGDVDIGACIRAGRGG